MNKRYTKTTTAWAKPTRNNKTRSTQVILTDKVLNMLDRKIRELDVKSKSMVKADKTQRQKTSKKRQGNNQTRRCSSPQGRKPLKGILRKRNCDGHNFNSEDDLGENSCNTVCYYSQHSPIIAPNFSTATNRSRIKSIQSVPNLRESPSCVNENRVRFDRSSHQNYSERNLQMLLKKYPYTQKSEVSRSPSCPRMGINDSHSIPAARNDWDSVRCIGDTIVSKYDKLFTDSLNSEKCDTQSSKLNKKEKPNCHSENKNGVVDDDFNMSRVSLKNYSSNKNEFYSKYSPILSNQFSTSALDSRFPGSSKLYQSNAMKNNTFGNDFTSTLSSSTLNTLGKFTSYTSKYNDYSRDRLRMDSPSYCDRIYANKFPISNKSNSYSIMKVAGVNNSNVKHSTFNSSVPTKSLGSSVDVFLESYLTDRRQKKPTLYHRSQSGYAFKSGDIENLLADIRIRTGNASSYLKDLHGKTSNYDKLTDNIYTTSNSIYSPTDTIKITQDSTSENSHGISLKTGECKKTITCDLKETNAHNTSKCVKSYQNIEDRIKSTCSSELATDCLDKCQFEYPNNDLQTTSCKDLLIMSGNDAADGDVRVEGDNVNKGGGRGSMVDKNENNMLNIMKEQENRLYDLESMLGRV